MMLSKGLKRKREEEEEEKETLAVDAWWLDPSHSAVAQGPPAVASSSLFDLSVLKLHHSLRQSEPDLRHLVLVVNTLRRIQASMAPTAALPPVPTPPTAPSVADNLLASSDAALSASMASLLEDLSHIEGLSQAPQPLVDEGPLGRSAGEPHPAWVPWTCWAQPLAVCWTMGSRACLRTLTHPCMTVNSGHQSLRATNPALKMDQARR